MEDTPWDDHGQFMGASVLLCTGGTEALDISQSSLDGIGKRANVTQGFRMAVPAFTFPTFDGQDTFFSLLLIPVHHMVASPPRPGLLSFSPPRVPTPQLHSPVPLASLGASSRVCGHYKGTRHV